MRRLSFQMIQGENPMEFDVFLSHNAQDKPAVEETACAFARKLKRKYEVRGWLDKWNLISGNLSA